MRLRQAYNVIVKNCQAYNVHSLAQNSSAFGLTFENVYVEGLTGINILSSGNVEITESTIKASEENGFAVRADGGNSGSMKISTCTFSADRPVIVRKLKSTYNLTFEGKNSLTNYKRYQVVLINNDQDDQAYVVPTGTYTLTGADKFVVFPHTWVVSDADELQNAINSVKADVKINFAQSIEGNVYIAQKENIDIVIDGKGKKFDGTFTIDGNNRNNGEESVTFNNIKFNAKNADAYYIEEISSMPFIYCQDVINGEAEQYAHNIFVDNCTFTGNEKVVGVRTEKSFGVTIKNSTFTGMHSIGQFKSANKFTHLENVTAECLGGVNFNNQAANVVLDGCEITATDADGYCVRTDHIAGSSLIIKNSTLNAYCPVVLRSCSDQAYIKLENNTLVKKGLYDINIKSGVIPQNEGIEDYIVYPREVYVSPGFYQTSNGYTIKNAAENSTITLADDVNGTISIEKVKNITIEGNENTNVRFVTTANSKLENVTIKNAEFEFVTGAGQKNGAFVVIDAAAQIDNLVIEGCNIVGDGNKNSYGIFGQNTTASIEVKECNFANVGYAIQSTAGGGYKSLVVEECTFENIISWAILPQYGYTGDLTINSCAFNNSNGGLVKTGAFNGTFTFTNNALTSCTGHDGKDSKWFEVDASAANKVVSGNVKDGVEWTPGSEQGLK